MRLEWHSHMVSLPMVEKWLKDTFAGQYKGMLSVKDGFKVVLDHSVSQAQRDSVKTYWDSLDSESAEAGNYRGKAWFDAERSRIEAEAVATSWDDMLKLEVTDYELLGIE